MIDDRTEEQKLTDKIAWFKQKNEELVDKLAHLQQQHGEMKQLLTQRQHEEAAAMQIRQQQMRQEQMMREQQMRQEQQMRHEQQMRMQHEQQMRQEQQAREAAARGPPHNPDWTQQEHEGNVYYWNSATGESTYTRPPDFNPPGALGGMPGAGMPAGFGQLEPLGGAGMGMDMGSSQYGCSGGGQGHAGAKMRAANGPDRRLGSGAKGPPGANLFYFRKMNKGEHDDFTDADLVAEFSKFGELARAEMSIDRLTGRSKGFGFVSFMTVMAAEAAIAAVHNQVMRGRVCELQRTRED